MRVQPNFLQSSMRWVCGTPLQDMVHRLMHHKPLEEKKTYPSNDAVHRAVPAAFQPNTPFDVQYRINSHTQKISHMSPAIIRLTGYHADELLGTDLSHLIEETRVLKHQRMETIDYSIFLQERLNEPFKSWEADHLLKTKQGNYIWLSDISAPIYNEQNDCVGLMGSLRDITGRIQAEEHSRKHLVELAYSDALTGLGNRRLFFEKLSESLISQQNDSCSIMVIDIDHFKQINDTYGHFVGDHVIREVGQIIQQCLAPEDILTRLGGEEYGIILPHTPVRNAYWVAERIARKISHHAFYQDEVHGNAYVTVSIGVADTKTNTPINADSLFTEADARLYVAKVTRNQVYCGETYQS
ncbi:MAG: GGDEF domain-containing protein [Alphaproteobacteria bacterium]|nr:GGDEF domain-containing protein [Alphaproteobacteria bacterium]